MATKMISAKRLQINKANATIVIFVSIAAFVTVFSIFTSRALISQRSYQAKVIDKKSEALKQLKTNNQELEKLKESYNTFVGQTINVIEGQSTGTSDRDGDNAKIILDALPSKYDYPALATSLEKLLLDKNYQIDEISGDDDELAQAEQKDYTKAVEMPYKLEVTGNYGSIVELVKLLNKSIRPMHILKMELKGSNSKTTITIEAKTYYQPEKTLNITKETVK